jgi:hypothetical protein
MRAFPVARHAARALRSSEPVVQLVDARVRVLRLARGLASAGLTLRHDPQRNALVVACALPSSIQQTGAVGGSQQPRRPLRLAAARVSR